MRKEHTKKHKINVIDILIILFALICIVSIVARAASTMEAKQLFAPDEYRLYFQIDDIKASSYAFFNGHEGETVRIKSGGILGTLGNDFSRGAAVHTYTEDKDGTITETKYYHPEPSDETTYSEERCSIKGYISVAGKLVNNALWIDDTNCLLLGQSVQIVTEHISASITVTEFVQIAE